MAGRASPSWPGDRGPAGTRPRAGVPAPGARRGRRACRLRTSLLWRSPRCSPAFRRTTGTARDRAVFEGGRSGGLCARSYSPTPASSRGRKGYGTSPAPYGYQVARQGEIIRCPWHGWELDLTNGRSVYNPHRVRVRSYDVTVEDDTPDPSVDTFPVSVERKLGIVHV